MKSHRGLTGSAGHLMVNAISARPGGGLVVFEALLGGLLELSSNYAISVVVHHEDTYLTLRRLSDRNHRITLIRTPSLLGRLGVILQAIVMRYYSERYAASVVLSQNVYLSAVKVPQIVYHVNMFNFVPNASLTGQVDKFKQGLRHYSARKALSHASFNAFESMYLRTLASNVGSLCEEKCKVIYIGIDERWILSDCVASRASSSSTQLVMISNQQPHKRNEMAIDTLRDLVNRYPDVDWHLHVFGGLNDSVWAPLRQYAGELVARMTFHGYKRREEIVEVMDRSLCLLNTSRFESFCTVALEGMARGLPCIVTPHTGMPESVGDAGYVAKTDTVGEIVEHVLKLWSDPVTRRQSQRVSLEWSRQHTWRSAAQQFNIAIASRIAGQQACYSDNVPSHK